MKYGNIYGTLTLRAKNVYLFYKQVTFCWIRPSNYKIIVQKHVIENNQVSLYDKKIAFNID